MKYLSDYVQEKQTKLFNELGVFFAFGQQQFDEAKKEGVKYVSICSGGFVPVDKVEEFVKRHEKIVDEGRKQDVKENGIEKIIERELSNFECYYTGEIQDAVDRLEDYGVSYDEVLKVFRNTRDRHE